VEAAVKWALCVALALLALVLESVAIHFLGSTLVRIDVTVALVVFLALRAGVLEGAFSAFSVGYLLDVMSGHPTGLYVFLAVLAFLGVRLAGTLVEVRTVGFFVLFVVAAGVGHGLLAAFFTWMTSSDGAFPIASLTALPLQTALTALFGILTWPLLRRFEAPAEQGLSGSFYS
jgi:rod shape-determining protein MreD